MYAWNTFSVIYELHIKIFTTDYIEVRYNCTNSLNVALVISISL